MCATLVASLGERAVTLLLPWADLVRGSEPRRKERGMDILVEHKGETPDVPQMIGALAVRTAAYFRLLCEQDLDPEFAKLLARDWHTAQIEKWIAFPYSDRYKRPMTPDEERRREAMISG